MKLSPFQTRFIHDPTNIFLSNTHPAANGAAGAAAAASDDAILKAVAKTKEA